MNKKRIPIVIVAVLAVVSGGLIIKATFFKPDFRYAGTVEALKIDVPARTGSVVQKIEVETGRNVEAGQPLLEMTCEDQRLENSLVSENFTRMEKLLRQGSVAKESFDQIKNQKDLSDLKLSWCDVKSPIKGTILARYYEQGELVVPGTKLFTLADLVHVYAYIYVPQPYVAKVQLGEKVAVYLPELKNKEFDGTVSEIGEQAEFTPKNVQTRSERERLVYSVKVEFINPDGVLKPGMTVEVKLPEAQ